MPMSTNSGLVLYTKHSILFRGDLVTSQPGTATLKQDGVADNKSGAHHFAPARRIE